MIKRLILIGALCSLLPLLVGSIRMMQSVAADDLFPVEAVATEPVEDKAESRKLILEKLTATGRQGTKGRLVWDDCSFSVALYESDINGHPNATVIVNAEDSACWFMWYGSESPTIADHCTQGFDIIKDCSIGDICYIVDGDDYQKYVCVAVDHDGINERHDMYLSDGYNFMRENDPGYLYMYTCNEAGDPYHITVVVWVPDDETNMEE